MELHMIGIDFGNAVFHLVGLARMRNCSASLIFSSRTAAFHGEAARQINWYCGLFRRQSHQINMTSRCC